MIPTFFFPRKIRKNLASIKSCSLARSYISPSLSLREEGTIDLLIDLFADES